MESTIAEAIKRLVGPLPTRGESALSIYFLPMLIIFFLTFVELNQVYSAISSSKSIADFRFPSLPLTIIYYSYVFVPLLVAIPVLVIWKYRDDQFVKSVALRATFRIHQPLIVTIILGLLFLIIAGIIILQYPYLANTYAFLALGGSFIIIIPNVLLIWIYRIPIFFLSPGVRKRVRSLRSGQFYSCVVGSAACGILENFEDCPTLTSREYTFLMVEIHSALRDVLKSELPRIRIRGTDSILVDILISVRTNNQSERHNVKTFFRTLKTVVLETSGKNRFSSVNQILNLIDSTFEGLSDSDKMRRRSMIDGYWNVSLIDKLKGYDIFIAIGILVLGAVSSLVALHFLP
ncbi:MAG: hypothetical protein M1344_02485 [Candidatus Thermoplasmatota archaeon]|nr:hypothetical protein [Candidatus Thermoplasmatota archaeon]